MNNRPNEFISNRGMFKAYKHPTQPDQYNIFSPQNSNGRVSFIYDVESNRIESFRTGAISPEAYGDLADLCSEIFDYGVEEVKEEKKHVAGPIPNNPWKELSIADMRMLMEWSQMKMGDALHNGNTPMSEYSYWNTMNELAAMELDNRIKLILKP